MSDIAATEALLGFADRGAPEPSRGPPVFDGADVSAGGLGARAHDASWWHAGVGGLRLSGRDLAGASLRRADLTGADLSGTNLAKASCGGIVLHRARLEEASFRGADLIGATLSDVDAGEADFSEAMLEDADLHAARLRFAVFAGAVMDGVNLSGADLWGARLNGAVAERADFRSARLDEAKLTGADLTAADLTDASLRRADCTGALLRGATLRGATLEGANLSGADLTNAVLPHVVLTGCELRHVRWAGAWLERTRMRAAQLGVIGEEVAGEFDAAREGYVVLEQNFRTLGMAEDERWAFLRRRRMGKRTHAGRARAAWSRRDGPMFLRAAARWLGDQAAEWLCDYGESVPRVLGAFIVVLLSFALLYWATGALALRDPAGSGARFAILDYLLFSLDSMTTVGTSELEIKTASLFGALLSSLQTVIGTVLLGLFGFVLGARMRN